MGDKSGIEWADATLNYVTGCERVSPGCDHCYAKTLVESRLTHNPRSVYYGRAFEDVRMHDERLALPLRWTRPRRVFVNSMSDAFHVHVPDTSLDRLFATLALSPQHVHQVLTKRAERIYRYTRDVTLERIAASIPEPSGLSIATSEARARIMRTAWPLPNVWLGVSIENNDYAWRADMLRKATCDVRFLSVEPMLGPVDRVALDGLNWVICGGESGPGSRPMDLAWVRDLRDRCVANGVAFFFKQWGGVQKKATGRELDGRTWDEMPAIGRVTFSAPSSRTRAKEPSLFDTRVLPSLSK